MLLLLLPHAPACLLLYTGVDRLDRAARKVPRTTATCHHSAGRCTSWRTSLSIEDCLRLCAPPCVQGGRARAGSRKLPHQGWAGRVLRVPAYPDRRSIAFATRWLLRREGICTCFRTCTYARVAVHVSKGRPTAGSCGRTKRRIADLRQFVLLQKWESEFGAGHEISMHASSRGRMATRAWRLGMIYNHSRHARGGARYIICMLHDAVVLSIAIV